MIAFDLMERKDFEKIIVANFKKRGKKRPAGSRITHWYELWKQGHDIKYLDSEVH